jgi:hypothetical protein
VFSNENECVTDTMGFFDCVGDGFHQRVLSSSVEELVRSVREDLSGSSPVGSGFLFTYGKRHLSAIESQRLGHI